MSKILELPVSRGRRIPLRVLINGPGPSTSPVSCSQYQKLQELIPELETRIHRLKNKETIYVKSSPCFGFQAETSPQQKDSVPAVTLTMGIGLP